MRQTEGVVAFVLIVVTTAAAHGVAAQTCNPLVTNARSALAWGPAPRDTADFSGRVVATQTGAPIFAAYVTVEPGRHVLSTDSIGWFRIPTLPHGRYDVRIRAIGYDEVHDSVTYGFGGLRMLATLSHGMGSIDFVCTSPARPPQ
jgi:hypothetical protein